MTATHPSRYFSRQGEREGLDVTNIEFVCTTTHAGELIPSHQLGRPTITVVEGVWGFCAHGAVENHGWERIDPTPLHVLQHRPPPKARGVQEIGPEVLRPR
jgi:hypothetical protein